MKLEYYKGNYNVFKEALIMKHNEIKNKYSSKVVDKLSYFQCNLKLDFGSFQEEYPEQTMAVRYLTGNEKVSR